MAPNRRQIIRQQAARKQYNERVRKINEQKRDRAQRINQRRRQAAKAEFRERTTAPSIESNEGLQRSLADSQRAYDDQVAGLDQQEQGLGVEYGMGQFGGDAASNPYSRAAMLQRSYNQNQRASLNTMASRGQLYAGATQNQANANTANYGSAYDALAKNFAARQGQIGTQRTQAQSQFGAANEAAYRKAIQETRESFPVTRENAPRMPRPKKFTPTFKKLRPPVRRPNPNRPAAPGAVRP